ncbi:late embryogenesis abundant protein 47-like [Salvia divinorum]|uniref:Late embryogenesis abundant protein 47-like n=1 Tax=Salvia divinorum TaxID=28513 RepID=A0ABD1GZN8_SALDI
MNQEQPSKHVEDTIKELNAQEAVIHPQTSSPNAHSNAVANQKEPVGVQGIKEIESSPLGSRTDQPGEITIGEALEATALTAGHRPVDYSDAAAIQAAEVRATGRTNIVPGGVAAAAQSAATRNARLPRDEDKTKLGEILSDASSKLPSDKPVTRRDAEGVIGAELRNDPNLCTRPGGVAASIAAAARLNQTNASNNIQNKTN